MSVFRRIWKPKQRTDPEVFTDKAEPLDTPITDLVTEAPARAKSVADGFVSIFVRDRKPSTNALRPPVEFKARANPPNLKRPAARRTPSNASSSLSSDIRCPSDLGAQRGSFESEEVDSASASLASFSCSPLYPSHQRNLPTELLANIFKYTSRHSLPALARVNRTFHDEVMRIMYSSVDLIPNVSHTPGGISHLDTGLDTLCASTELAELVREFKYRVPRPVDNREHSLEPLQHVLRKLPNMKALHLENAPLHLLHDMPLMLTHLHVECSFAYAEPNRAHDLTLLGTWLSSQSALISLHLLNCDTITLTNNQALPHLAIVAGCAAVAASLTQFRPVTQVAMTLCKADETRTTPSRIMASLARSSAPLLALDLDLTMTDVPYEIFLTAAATRLQFLRSLSVTGTHKALELLFKQIHHFLVPLSSLHTVRMCTLPHVPHHHDTEFARVKIWYKLCPSLRLIQLPSGMEWFITLDESAVELGGAPVVGKRSPDAGGGLRRLRML